MEQELSEIFEKHKEELLELDTQRLEETFDLILKIIKMQKNDKVLISTIKDMIRSTDKHYNETIERYRNYMCYGPEYQSGYKIGEQVGRKIALKEILNILEKRNSNE